MLLSALVIAVAAISAANADPKNAPPPGVNLPHSHNPKEVRYEYRYAVDDPVSGVVNTRWEHRLGEYVKGAYSLVEPDGSVRHVDYEVDGERGFHAVVRTLPPGKLLSTDQLSQSRQHHKQPPVNELTNLPEAAEATTGRAVRTGRRLPVNFHSVRPDYYLAFAKGEPARYRESQPLLELPEESPREAPEHALDPPPPPPPPPPAAASTHHHHYTGLDDRGGGGGGGRYATLRDLLQPPPRRVAARPLPDLPPELRGRALTSISPAPFGYPTHTEVIFAPFPPITLASDYFEGRPQPPPRFTNGLSLPLQ